MNLDLCAMRLVGDAVQLVQSSPAAVAWATREKRVAALWARALRVLDAQRAQQRGAQPADPVLAHLVHEFVTQLNRKKWSRGGVLELENAIRAHLQEIGLPVEPSELAAESRTGGGVS